MKMTLKNGVVLEGTAEEIMWWTQKWTVWSKSQKAKVSSPESHKSKVSLHENKMNILGPDVIRVGNHIFCV